MDRLLGPGHVTECTTFVAVLIESASIYATFSLLFLIPFALGSPVSYTFLQVLGEAQVSSLNRPPRFIPSLIAVMGEVEAMLLSD